MTGTIKLYVNDVMIADYQYASFDQICDILQRWRMGMDGLGYEAYAHIIPDIREIEEPIKEIPSKKEVTEPKRKIAADIQAKYVRPQVKISTVARRFTGYK